MARLAHTLLLVLSIALSQNANATTIRPLDASALVRSSSDIVVGTVVSQSSRWDGSHRRIVTDVKVLVSERLKGAPADTLTLTQLGGELDGARYEVPGAPRFKIGEEIVLFAWRDKKGLAQANGLSQGKCEVTRDASGARTVLGLPAGLVTQARAKVMRVGATSLDREAAPLSDALGAIRAELARQ